MNKRLNTNLKTGNLRSKGKFLIAWLLTLCLLMYSPTGTLMAASESNESITNSVQEEPLFQSQSTTPSGITVTTPSAIAVKNYIQGISDRVTVSGLNPGETVNVYDQGTGGALLGQGTVALGETSVTIDIPQLTQGAGTVYISVTNTGTESDRVEVNYVGEPILWQIYDHTGYWNEDANPAPNLVYPDLGDGTTDDSPLGKEYNKHIVIKGSGDRITFYGYGVPGYSDFVFLPSDSNSEKTLTFDMDISKVSYHSMEGAGIIINSKIEAGKLNGYIVLFTSGGIKLYKANNVSVQALRDTSKYSITEIAGITAESGAAAVDSTNPHEITLQASPGKIILKDNGVTKINRTDLEAGGSGIGFIASHTKHNCQELSYYTITNVSISDTVGSQFTWPLLDLSGTPGNGSVYLTYTPPVEAEVVVLQQSTNGAIFYNVTTSSAITPETSFITVPDLNNGTKYYYRLLVGGGKNAGISNVVDVIPSASANTPPVANNVTITGTAKVGQVLTGSYAYSDANGDSQGTSKFKWYRCNASDGNDKQAIPGATAKNYTVTVGDIGKYLFFEVTPVATAGVLTGAAVVSEVTGPVQSPNSAPAATSVSINGTREVGQILTGKYTYHDVDSDPEGTSTFKWYRSNASDGSGKVVIVGANSNTYKLGADDHDKYIFFEVTPVANSGVLTGTPEVSAGVGKVTLPQFMALTGTVTEQDSGEKIANATVILKDLRGKKILETKTDEQGIYGFDEVILGKYKIIIENPQYSTKSIDVVVMPDGSGNLSLTKNIQLVDFIVTLVADPSSIIGDGIQTTTLKALITDKDNKPIPGIEVNFSALDGNFPFGSFPNGPKATTDNQGKSSVEYQSANLAGIESKTIIVRAEVNDTIRNLYAVSEILVTFEPSSIQGVVLDNSTGFPIEGAIVEVSKDFNEDGIADFYAKMITGSDGKYKIAVPKGSTSYNIDITKPILVNNSLKSVTFSQTCNVGGITGVGDETFDSSKTITGLVLSKAPNGDVQELTSYTNYEVELVDSNKNPVSSSVDSKGIFKVEGLTKGESYTINLKYDFGDGQKIIVGKAVATVTDDGQIGISTMLIDPYGIVTDKVTNQSISGVNMKLYWADTALNSSKGRTPGTLVNLPILPGFAPNDNANPQFTSNTGNYAWMVFPDGDYYIIAEKSGYYTYDSRREKRNVPVQPGEDSYITNGIIHVGTSIVHYDLQMEPRDDDEGGSSAPTISVPPTVPIMENTASIVNPQSPVLVVPADGLSKKEILTAAINQYNELEKTKAQKENRVPQLISVSDLNESAYIISSSNASIADFDTHGILNISGKGLFAIRISEKGTNTVYEYLMVASQGLQRIAGTSRIDTALAIARGSYYGKVKSVVVARADDFPDALTGSVLAYKKEAPVLLVGRSEEDCQKLIEYLKGYLEPQGTVYILGGTGAVSQYVEDSVKSNGYSNVMRLGGADRYGTAAKISEQLDISQGRPVVIASGKSFPDSLSVSSIAAAQQFPLLIVNPNSVPEEIKEKLTQLKPSMVYIIGLQGAVSDQVRNEIAQLTGLEHGKIIRIGGEDRYASTLAVAQYFNPSGRGVSIATGRDFPDALAGSVYSAKLKDPLILVEDTLSANLKNYLSGRKPFDIVIFGGQGAVSPAIEEELKGLVE